LEGWSVKDLSYKYGILPQRVKAIVWNREIFWKQVYPKIGESGYRLLMNKEESYGKIFKWVDYGKDLHVMTAMEQGVKVKNIERKEPDIKPSEKEIKYLSEELLKVRPKIFDLITTGFVGKGPKGYMIKDMNYRRGRGCMRVSKMFKKYLRFNHCNRNFLPKRVLDKAELGPRLATLGFRH